MSAGKKSGYLEERVIKRIADVSDDKKCLDNYEYFQEVTFFRDLHWDFCKYDNFELFYDLSDITFNVNARWRSALNVRWKCENSRCSSILCEIICNSCDKKQSLSWHEEILDDRTRCKPPTHGWHSRTRLYRSDANTINIWIRCACMETIFDLMYRWYVSLSFLSVANLANSTLIYRVSRRYNINVIFEAFTVHEETLDFRGLSQ